MTDNITGNVFIIASPSGGGKTSLVNKLVNTLENIQVSISHTTREIRLGEQEGLDYFFITQEQFLTKIKENAFVEYAKVYDKYYGTSLAQIKTRLSKGIDVVLDIDWQGAQQIKRLIPNAIGVFIVPPSLKVLQERLQNRQRDDEKIIFDRMQRAQDELKHFTEFDYLIVNEHFEKAAEELKAIVIATRLRKDYQSVKLAKLLSFLLAPQ